MDDLMPKTKKEKEWAEFWIKQGAEHSIMSPETKGAIKDLQKTIEIVNENFKENKIHIDYIRKDTTEIKRKMNEELVTKIEFEPVKKLVFGTVTLILVSFMAALIALVIAVK
jgi:hypothetical protein